MIKGIAVIMLLVHHCFLSAARYKGYTVDFFPLTESTTNEIAAFFKTCVGIFAFISGYGITYSIKKLDCNYNLSSRMYTQLMIRRYLNLMFGFWFIYLFAQLVPIGTGFDRYNTLYGPGLSGVLYRFFDFMGLSSLYKTPLGDSTWWYMSLGITIIFCMPLLLQLYRKLGLLLLFIMLLVPRGLRLEMSNISRWFPIVILGIICADTLLLDKLKSYQFVSNSLINKLAKLILSGALILLFIELRNDPGTSSYRDLWDGIVPLIIVYFCFEFIVDIPLINNCLNYLGKHSMNIFLIHTSLREYYYQDFYYQFKYAWIIVLVLLVTSLLLSILIEALKKFTRYNQLSQFVINKVSTISFHNPNRSWFKYTVCTSIRID